MIKIINKLKDKKGFTLIELIVVLAVLAIIMAIAVPRFLGVQENAKIEADRSTLASIAKTAELYFVQGKVPSAYSTGTGAIIKDDATESVLKTFLTDMQKDLPNVDFQSNGHTGDDLGDVNLFIDASGIAKVKLGTIEYPK